MVFAIPIREISFMNSGHPKLKNPVRNVRKKSHPVTWILLASFESGLKLIKF
jgi:hypothetical protein